MHWRKLGIITGGGALPLKLAAACRNKDIPTFLIRLEGAADKAADEFSGADCAIGEAGKIIRLLKEEACDAVAMAGVVKRPDFKSIKADWRGAALLPRIISAAARGDGALLNVLVDTLEAEGFTVVGADDVAVELAAGHGTFTSIAPTTEQLSDIRKAAAVVAALGPFDVGQGAVVANGLVLAVEAAEGTDAMLARVGELPSATRGGPRSGVLVKRPKPGQEVRVDLPTIGAQTVRLAADAGLAGIAVEAGRALFLDEEEAVAIAHERGLFVYGFTQQELTV